MLNLRPGTREHFLAALERDWPEESTRYERLYEGRSYLRRREPARSASSCGASPASMDASAGRRCGRRAEPVQLTLI